VRALRVRVRHSWWTNPCPVALLQDTIAYLKWRDDKEAAAHDQRAEMADLRKRRRVPGTTPADVKKAPNPAVIRTLTRIPTLDANPWPSPYPQP
jgi:hypothetical protein